MHMVLRWMDANPRTQAHTIKRAKTREASATRPPLLQRKRPNKMPGIGQNVCMRPIDCGTRNELTIQNVATDLLPYRPFVPTNRAGQWMLHEQGKKWVCDRITQYEDIQGPGGVDEEHREQRANAHKTAWKKKLAADYHANWPDFEWEEVTGVGASASALKTAQSVSLRLIWLVHDQLPALSMYFRSARRCT
jgi:hypothetical protein